MFQNKVIDTEYMQDRPNANRVLTFTEEVEAWLTKQGEEVLDADIPLDLYRGGMALIGTKSYCGRLYLVL